MARYVWDERGGLAEHIRVFVDGREIRHLQGSTRRSLPVPSWTSFPSAGG